MKDIYAHSEIVFHNVSVGDSKILYVGQEKCVSNHSYGPSVRSHYLLVYIISGKGAFRSQNNTYQLGQGASFVVFPGERIFYVADSKDPWHYYWIAFSGMYFQSILARASITPRYPVSVMPENSILPDLYENIMVFTMEKNTYVDIKIISLFLDILYQHVTGANMANRVRATDMARPTSPHVDNAIEYIHKNYGNDLSVSELASHLNITREHFSKLFKEHFKVSPVLFIRNYRLQSAKILLLTTKLAVSEIAEQTGFNDYNYFSAQFSRLYEVSPSEFRKNSREWDALNKNRNSDFVVR